MEKESNTSSSGIGFVGLLTIVFITLKLMKYIDWSWWWVLSPLWISTLLTVSIFVVWLLVTSIFERYKSKKYKDHASKPPIPKSGFMKRLEEAQRIQKENLEKRLQAKKDNNIE